MTELARKERKFSEAVKTNRNRTPEELAALPGGHPKTVL